MKCTKLVDLLRSLNMNTPEFALSQSEEHKLCVSGEIESKSQNNSPETANFKGLHKKRFTGKNHLKKLFRVLQKYERLPSSHLQLQFICSKSTIETSEMSFQS